eukprot:8326917-Lingulodinium_polyedra.AAC.1
MGFSRVACRKAVTKPSVLRKFIRESRTISKVSDGKSWPENAFATFPKPAMYSTHQRSAGGWPAVSLIMAK